MSENRAAKKLLVFVIGFYVAVSVLAVAILNLSGSIFAKRGEVNLMDYFSRLGGNEENLVEKSIEEVDPESKLQGLEALDGADDAQGKEEATEPPTEVSEEPSIESYEEPTPAAEETVPEEPPVEEVHYYSFKTNNTDTILRMREAPGEDAKVVYELKPGSSGYVTELGDEWSKVSAYGHEGYCANEFLTMTEISESEYDELKEQSDNAASAGNKTDAAAAAGTADQTGTAGQTAADQTAVQTGTADQSAAAGTGTADQAAPAQTGTADQTAPAQTGAADQTAAAGQAGVITMGTAGATPSEDP